MIYDSKIKSKDVDGLFEAILLLENLEELMSRYKISGLPVIEDDGKLIGIITNRDIKYRKDLDQPVGDIMTSKGLITAPVGTTLEQAKEILLANRIEKLPITDQNDKSIKMFSFTKK